MQRRELERILAAVPGHPHPRAELEQYRTPDEIAAALLLQADADGALAGRRVLDLGCGTGLFAVGALALGANGVAGVDVDPEALGEARVAVGRLPAGASARASFVHADLATWHPAAGAFDTVLMNPPFGAQAANRHADRLFLERAAEAVRPAGTVWFLAQVRTERFLTAFAGELGGRLERVGAWDYPLPAQFDFHLDEVRLVRVGGYRLAWS